MGKSLLNVLLELSSGSFFCEFFLQIPARSFFWNFLLELSLRSSFGKFLLKTSPTLSSSSFCSHSGRKAKSCTFAMSKVAAAASHGLTQCLLRCHIVLWHLHGVSSNFLLLFLLFSCLSITSQYVPEGTLCGRWWILVDVDAVDDGLVVPLLAPVATSVASSVAVGILSVLVAATTLLLLLPATLLLLTTAFLLLLLLL